MKLMNLLSVIFLFVVVSCSTTTSFKIPPKSTLYVDGKQVPETALTRYKRSPFFWSKASGIPYRIEQNGKVVDQGKIKSHFRVWSIFWPPFAIIYWPIRFEEMGYDFTSKSDFKVRPEPGFISVPYRK